MPLDFIRGFGPDVRLLLGALGVTDTDTCTGATLEINAGQLATVTVRRLVTRDQADALTAELVTLAAAGKVVKVVEEPADATNLEG